MLLYSIFLLTVLGKTASQVELGSSYKFLQTVKLSDEGSNAFGYQIRSTAEIEQVHSELYSVKLNDLKFLRGSKGDPTNYVEKKSVLDSSDNNVFFIEIKNGKINNLQVADSEELPLINIKKSFSSLLQFQLTEGQIQENDINGNCMAKYELIGNSVIRKTKTNCQTDVQGLKGGVWSGLVIPQIETTINLSSNKLISLSHKENYKVKTSIAEYAETLISVSIDLQHVGSIKNGFDNKNGKESIETLIKRTSEKLGKKYIKYNLATELSLYKNEKDNELQLKNVLKENIKFLANEKLGSRHSAVASLKVVQSLKKASFDEISNALKAKSSKKILGQLLDILGGVQTTESHKAAMTFLNLNSKEYNLDLCERYLWALSTSTHQEKSIITDLLELSQGEIDDTKLLETLVQTIASLVKKYNKDAQDNELLDRTIDYFTKKLESCSKTDELCQRIYLKAFTNLASSKVTSLLIEYSLNAPKRIGIQAMKALWNIGHNSWNKEVLRTAECVYLANGTYDSSAKIIALDILLESSLPGSCLSKIISPLKNRDVPNELKEYLLQRLEQVSQKCEIYRRHIKSSLLTEGLYHYDALAQGGFSTVFERRFMKNGYLSTTQEVKSGILKQGYVNINLEQDGSPDKIFTLGLFTNGLSSFVSDSEEDEDEEVNAGLELTVLGVQFRPFVFFEGQGELMGHVFSGSGSTLTPAYQAILLLSDEQGYLPIGTGDFISVKYSSVASVDLSGKIEISLWSRNAESLVQNSAGLVINKVVSISSPFINLRRELNLTVEPQLKLSSSIQFSGQVALCLQLEQPQSIVQYNSTLTGNTIKSSYKMRKFRSRNIIVPGTSYSLNSKNNEMCNIMFNTS